MSDILSYRNIWYSQARIKLLGKDNSTLIPDVTLDFWVELAERLIKLKVPTYATIISTGGNNKEFLIDATISQLCAMFVTPLRNIIATEVKVGEISEKKNINFDKLEADLYNEVEFFLSQLTTGYTAITGITRTGKIENTAMFDNI